MANIQPNRFVLQSSDGTTKVDYETSSFIGQPTLNLTQGPSPTVPIRHFVRIANPHAQDGDRNISHCDDSVNG